MVYDISIKIDKMKLLFNLIFNGSILNFILLLCLQIWIVVTIEMASSAKRRFPQVPKARRHFLQGQVKAGAHHPIQEACPQARQAHAAEAQDINKIF